MKIYLVFLLHLLLLNGLLAQNYRELKLFFDKIVEKHAEMLEFKRE